MIKEKEKGSKSGVMSSTSSHKYTLFRTLKLCALQCRSDTPGSRFTEA
jgi:hypothetical protein